MFSSSLLLLSLLAAAGIFGAATSRIYHSTPARQPDLTAASRKSDGGAVRDLAQCLRAKRDKSLLTERVTVLSSSKCMSICPSATRWYCVKTTQATIIKSSMIDSGLAHPKIRKGSPLPVAQPGCFPEWHT